MWAEAARVAIIAFFATGVFGSPKRHVHGSIDATDSSLEGSHNHIGFNAWHRQVMEMERSDVARHKVWKPLSDDTNNGLEPFAEAALDEVIALWQSRKIIEAYPDEVTEPMPNPIPETRNQAIEIIKTKMKAFIDNPPFKESCKDNPEVDAETENALVEAGLCNKAQAKTCLMANSCSDWSNLAKPSGEIRQALIDLFAYTPNDKARGKAKHTLIGYYVRILFELRNDDNLGAVVLKLNENYPEAYGPSPWTTEKPFVLFRSSTMVGVKEPDSALKSLLSTGKVNRVVNLYAGHFPLHDLIDEEEDVCKAAGVPHFNEAKEVPLRKWRELLDEEIYEQEKYRAMEIVSKVILRILPPFGAVKGNSLVHCGGGMHRTGMIIGIIRKFFGAGDMETIIADYKRHVAWESEDESGGYEEMNIQFIKEFDFGILKKEIDEAMGSAPVLTPLVAQMQSYSAAAEDTQFEEEKQFV